MVQKFNSLSRVHQRYRQVVTTDIAIFCDVSGNNLLPRDVMQRGVADYAVARCPRVRLSVRHTLVFNQNS